MHVKKTWDITNYITMDNINFDEMKYDYLFEYAKLIGVRGYYRMRKAELMISEENLLDRYG